MPIQHAIGDVEIRYTLSRKGQTAEVKQGRPGGRNRVVVCRRDDDEWEQVWGMSKIDAEGQAVLDLQPPLIPCLCSDGCVWIGSLNRSVMVPARVTATRWDAVPTIRDLLEAEVRRREEYIKWRHGLHTPRPSPLRSWVLKVLKRLGWCTE